MGMTTPLWCLVPGLFMPYVWDGIAAPLRKAQLGVIDNKEPHAQVPKLSGKAARAYAAHLNAFEALVIFAAAVFAAHLAGADPVWSSRLAIGWIVLRLLHGAAYIANIDNLRSTLFFLALGCAGGLFVLAARAG